MGKLVLKIQYGINTGLVISPTELRSKYLFGIPMCSNDGTKMSTEAIMNHIRTAQTAVENLFSIKLNKTVIEENRDYIREQFASWGFVRATYPVVKIACLKGYINEVCQLEYPSDWLVIKRTQHVASYRNIYLIPNTGGKEGATMTQNSLIYNGVSPHLAWWGQTFIPGYWRILYTTGWDTIPADLMDLVAKYAAINVLAVIGDVLYGIGITSINITLDGVNQSTPLSRSGQGGLFAGRLKQYTEDIERMLPEMKGRYRGISFEVL